MITITRADIWDEGYSASLSGKMIGTRQSHEDPDVIMISLNEIIHGGHPPWRWEPLMEALGKPQADDVPFPLETALGLNGADNVLFYIEQLNPCYKNAVELLICNIAESVLPIFEKYYPKDCCVRHCIEARRSWALGDISDEEWCAAQDAGRDALLAPTRFTGERDMKGEAAWVAAWAIFADCSWDAAHGATRAAEMEAIFTAVGTVKWSIETNTAINEAWDAGRSAEIEKQAAMLRDFCNLRGDYKKCIRNDDPIIPTWG